MIGFLMADAAISRVEIPASVPIVFAPVGSCL
jgi:hypothetical protein